MADEAGTRTRRRRCTALTLAVVALLAPSTASADRLRTIDVASGTSTLLASSPTLEWIDRPCWAPDGRVVALEYRSTRHTLQRRYVAYDAEGGRQVLGRANRFTTYTAFAPGCTRVAERRRRLPFAGRGVLVRDLAGPALAELAGLPSHRQPSLAWSPDGALLADASGEREPYTDAGTDPVVRVTEVAGGGVVAEAPAQSTFAGLSAGAFAPDGRAAVLVRGLLEDPGAELTILDVAAQSLRTIAFAETVHDAAWSPRGDRIAAVVDDALHLYDPAGADLGIVAPGARAHAIAWSPDGAQIAFTAFRRTSTSHYVVPAQPGAVHRRLYVSRALSSTPLAWSPDGARLAFAGG